jgi:hypothetical protein
MADALRESMTAVTDRLAALKAADALRRGDSSEGKELIGLMSPDFRKKLARERR